ncbi:hypothetical protein V6Z12_A12G187100 [Gossypium hirsutum]
MVCRSRIRTPRHGSYRQRYIRIFIKIRPTLSSTSIGPRGGCKDRSINTGNSRQANAWASTLGAQALGFVRHVTPDPRYEAEACPALSSPSKLAFGLGAIFPPKSPFDYCDSKKLGYPL